jgi:twinkle protein
MCDYYEPPTDGGNYEAPERTERHPDLINGEFRALKARGISEETCKRFGYRVGKFNGQTVHIAEYRDEDGAVVGQKLRFKDKEEGMPILGKQKKLRFFGQHLTLKGKRRIVVTEGELDCLSVSQINGNKWPVVSLPLGCDDAAKAFARNLEFLNQFEEVVIMFDMDPQGQAAAEKCARVVKPGSAMIAALPLKDANEMLLKGRSGEVIDAIFNAKPYRPAGLVSFKDIREKVEKPIEWGLPWFSTSLTNLTYGRRTGEIYALGAGTGIGKTDWFTQQIIYDTMVLDQKVCLFYLEQEPGETGKRLAGKYAGRRFHIPRLKDQPDVELPKGYKEEWTDEELSDAIDHLDNDKLLFFDSFGANEWDLIKDTIRFVALTEGTKIFYLDHLTALAASEDDERKGLERITAEMGSLVKELDIMIIMISHLATPEGKPHEEGGRVAIRHFKGSRAIGFWCHYMFGLERDQQHKDPRMRSITTFRVLKDRYTGNSTGELIYFGYDRENGQLFETELPEEQDDTNADYGFTDQGGDF